MQRGAHWAWHYETRALLPRQSRIQAELLMSELSKNGTGVKWKAAE